MFRPLVVLFLLGQVTLYGQSQLNHGRYYNWFDEQIGRENTGLYEGILYKEQFRTINQNTPYFSSPDFLKGSVWYKGQPYGELALKYNVFLDQLLIKVEDRLGGTTLQLFREQLSRFTIDGHRFLNVWDSEANPGINGFYEVTLQTPSFTLLTKHRKKLFDRKDRSSLYYEFLPLPKEYVLQYQGKFHLISSKRDVTDLFPELQDPINAFYNRARAQRRTDPQAFTFALFQRIGSLLPLQKSNARP